MLREARTHEKLTRQIRVGTPFLVTERLHRNLTEVTQIIGNAALVSALRMSALEGSQMILRTFGKSTNAIIENAQTIIDEKLQDRMRKAICDFEDAISECAATNTCDEFRALEILLQIGALHGKCNGYTAPEIDVRSVRRRA